jgi:hypothetical protein
MQRAEHSTTGGITQRQRDLGSRAKAVGGAGLPLDATTRSRLEPGFGHDFSSVRVHADVEADTLAQGFEAVAFTAGEDIFFRQGAFVPDDPAGQRLLAHELTHVVQHARFGSLTSAGDTRDGGPGAITVSHPSDNSESEARAAADAVLGGHTTSVSAPPSAAIAREGEQGGGQEEESWWQKGLWGLGSILPGGLGAAVEGTHAAKEGAGATDPAKQAVSLTSAMFSPLAAAKEMGQWGSDTALGGFTNGAMGTLGAAGSALDAYSDFSKGNYMKGAYDVGSGLMSAGGIGGASLLGEGGAWGALTTGSLGEGALLTEGLGAIGGAGAGALATAGGAVLASGAAGALVGDYLSKHTEVGEDTQGSLGWLDRALGGDPEHGKSAVVAMDDYRQEQWDKGGMGYLKGTGALLGEAAVGTAGAIGGLAEGAVHGVEALGEGAWHGVESAGSAIGSAAEKVWDWL